MIKGQRLFFFLVAIATIFLVACGSATVETTPVPMSTQAFLPNFTASPALLLITKTKEPTAIRPSKTPVVPSKTPTPISYRQSCLVDKPDLVPTFALPKFDVTSYPLDEDFEKRVLDFLNLGGARKALIDYIKKNDDAPLAHQILEQDLNQDGIPELMLFENHVRIYTCIDRSYYVAADEYIGIDPLGWIAIQDMNSNNMPEIVFERDNMAPVDASSGYKILEWDGKNFQSLIAPYEYGSDNHSYVQTYIFGGWFQVDGSSQLQVDRWKIVDIDHNGTQELVFNGGLYSGFDARIHGPQRALTTTLMWNGKNFVVHDAEYSPATFRFQAVQDADYSALIGQYNKAFRLYQQVISSDTLDWWSDERTKYIAAQALADMDNTSPTPVMPAPDPLERENLSAYAYYRMMVLKILQKEPTEAQKTYQTLLARFPEEKQGHVYVELARAFWDIYKTSKNLTYACRAAIQYATANRKAILYYIGDREHHPWQNLDYKPEDICPFHQ